MKIRSHIEEALLMVLILVILFFVRDIYIKLRKINLVKLNKELSRVMNLNDQLQRNSVNVFFDLARIHTQEKDFDRAVLLYERGLQFNSLKPDEIFELAYVYEKKGIKDKAFEKLNQVLNLKPSFITLLATKLELAKLKSRTK